MRTKRNKITKGKFLMLRYPDGNGNERNKINKEEAWSDGKCGREVKDKDYYSRSQAQIST